MKLYKLTFNEYTNYVTKDISSQEKVQPYYLATTDGVLYVAVDSFDELKLLEPYGKGIKSVEFIGGVLILEPKEGDK